MHSGLLRFSWVMASETRDFLGLAKFLNQTQSRNPRAKIVKQKYFYDSSTRMYNCFWIKYHVQGLLGVSHLPQSTTQHSAFICFVQA